MYIPKSVAIIRPNVLPIARPLHLCNTYASTEGNGMDLNELTNALETFSKIDPEVQIQTMMCFLYVAKRGKCSQKGVELDLKLTNAAASRNISYWTDRRFDRKPGKDFIERREDDHDRRYKVLQLTLKGQSFLDKLTGERHGKTIRKQVDR